jgi:NADH:ubiquinone reductase (H+-translocating)
MGERSEQHPAGQPRVVVVGAGFAGLTAVRTLARSRAGVTLIDRNPASTFQPLLYEVATAGLAESDISAPLRPFAWRHRARFRRGELAGLDQQAAEVELADGSRVGYDYLILAFGTSAAYFGVPGAAEHSYGLYTRQDARRLRCTLIAALEEMSAGPGLSLSVVIVGGGPTGLELAGTLADLRNIALKAAYPDVRPARIKVTLVEQGPVLLAPFAPKLRDYALRALCSRGVDVRLCTAIKEVRAGSVLLDGGSELASDVTVWAAGVAAPLVARTLGLPAGHGGRLQVGADLRVSGSDRIFAAGDLAIEPEHPAPQLAQPAIQQGRHAARQIERLLAGKPTEPFRYHDKGIVATIGRRSAVIELPRLVQLGGTLAWLSWLALHVVTLLGNRSRVITLVNLAWRYLTWSRGGGIIAVGEPPMPWEPPEPLGAEQALRPLSTRGHAQPLAGQAPDSQAAVR